MRQKKMENFLQANSILAVAIGLAINSFFSKTQNISIYLTIGISIIGLIISVTWTFVMRRNSDYMKFQRKQLRDIEDAIPEGFRTFTKLQEAFDDKKKTKSISANKIENFLPVIIAVSWIAVINICVLFLTHVIALT